MTDDTEKIDSEATDARIAMRFAQLRAAEAAGAPAVTMASLQHTRTGFLYAVLPGRQSLPRVAAGLGLLALTLTLFSQRSEEDPAALYASIMGKQSMHTDTLLQVSPGVLPATTAMPSLYEFNMSFDPEKYTN